MLAFAPKQKKTPPHEIRFQRYQIKIMPQKTSPHTNNQTQNKRVFTVRKMLPKMLVFCVVVVGFLCFVVTGVYGILLFATDKMSRLCHDKLNSVRVQSISMIAGISCLILFSTIFSGCSHTAVNRGHIISLEYNRPPWIGCPPDTGCDTERTCKLGHSKSSCDCDENSQTQSGVAGKKFRRHCGLKPNCTAKNPCCELPGCGMWVDPADANSFAANSRLPRACGLTPFCSPMKPCGMTPNCARPVNPYFFNQPAPMPYSFNNPYAGANMFPYNSNLTNGLTLPLSVATPSTAPNSPATISPPPISTPPITPNNNNNNNPPPKTNQTKPANIAGPNGILVSMGIVPGVSAINGGGYVAANGVVTPNGIMTANGIQLPNGTTNSQMVIKVCGSHPACSPSRPCGMLSSCGAAVPVGLVSNNAVPLAAEIIARSRSGGVVHAADGNSYNGYGNVMQVNGTATQYPRNSTNYITNYNNPQNTAGYKIPNNSDSRTPPLLQPDLYNNDLSENESELDDETEIENSVDQTDVNQNKKSMMPLPRFHSVPTEPAFNRRKGIPVQKTSERTGNNKISKNSINNNRNNYTDETTIENAYLKGMVAALDEVDAELDSQMGEIENEKMKNLAIKKAEKLQAKIDAKAAYESEYKTETAESESARQKQLQEKQLQEFAIQSEQLKFEQQRNAKILAKRQAEIDKESQILEIERNRLRQEQIAMKKSQNNNQQQITTNNSNVQPASYQTTKKEDKNVFASAVNFLKGSPKNNDQTNTSQQNQPPKNTKNLVAQNNTPQKTKPKQNQNTKQQTGTVRRFFSPITNLISSEPNTTTQQTQKNTTKKITNTAEIAENNLPARPATFTDKSKFK
jgi:hypothetical protein